MEGTVPAKALGAHLMVCHGNKRQWCFPDAQAKEVAGETAQVRVQTLLAASQQALRVCFCFKGRRIMLSLRF